jgi:GT2 family glycosyltransferase
MSHSERTVSNVNGSDAVMSVIVPVHNGRDLIVDCLSAVRDQAGLEAHDIELIVVDDGSTDGSADVAEPLCDTLIRMEENRGAATARNRGVAEANADLLVFVDADVFLAPDALARVREEFEADKELAAAVGRYSRIPKAEGFVNVYHNAFTRYHHDLSPREIDWFWGALGAVNKAAFFAAGGFDERYSGASAEDMELGMALARAGFRIRYCPEVEGGHAHHFTLRGMLENDYKKAVRGMQLMLAGSLPRKAPRFASLENVATLVIIGSLMLSILVGGNRLLFLASVVLLVAGAKIGPFQNHLREHFSIWAMPKVLSLYWLQLLATGAGAACGALGFLLGRRPYGRLSWI